MKRNHWTIGVSAVVLAAGMLGLQGPGKAEAATQATYYASPAGSGTTCSLSAPCSLAGARDKVSTVNGSMTGDIYVYLRGGTYSLSGPLDFDQTDSGTNGYKVYYKNYTGETPVISGGADLSTGWTVHDAAKNIYQKSVGTLQFRQLYVNNAQAVRARTPNRSNTDDFGPYYETVGANTTNKTITINKSEIASWNHLNQVEMVLNPHWYHDNLRLSSYTTDTNYAYVSFQAAEAAYAFNKNNAFLTGNAYYFENAYGLLDAPGEWYLDTAAQTLYYIPRAGETMNSVQIIAPQAETLFSLTCTAASPIHHVEFAGLTFMYSGWQAPSTGGLVATQALQPNNPIGTPPGEVKVTYANHIRFVDNTFTFAGANGLQFYEGVSDSQIVGNQFSYIAGNAINLDGIAQMNPSNANQTKGILVGNNTISRVGQVYTNGMGIFASFVKDTIIEHNDISYGPYSGMQIGNQTQANVEAGMSNNKIRHNNVHHMMQLHDDGGGIYTLGRQPGTQLFENYVHDIARDAWAMTYPIAALYNDNYSEFITVEHNVAVNTASTIYQQTGIGAKNNTYINNGTSDASVISKAGVQGSYTESSSNTIAYDCFNTTTTGAVPSGWSPITTGGTVTVRDAECDG